MKTIGVGELRQNPTRALGDVERGDSYSVTRHNREIARLVPAGRQAPVTADQVTAMYKLAPLPDDSWEQELERDRMIAATARAHGLVLVTRNIKDYSQIQDAIAIDPMGKLVFKISSWSSSRATLAQPGVIARTYVACCYHANHACPSRPNRQLARRIT